MSRRILLLGGHGLVGSHITRQLARSADLTLLVAGRDGASVRQFVEYLLEEGVDARAVVVTGGVGEVVARERPALVIDASGTVGPDHSTARACIAASVPYIDVSDERATVLAVRGLNDLAVEAGVPVLSGAGVVPCLTMAAAAALAASLQEVVGARVILHRGNREEYGAASIVALLRRAGARVQWRRGGRGQAVRGLQTPARVADARHGNGLMLAYDAPELDMLLEVWPDLEEATVWAGIELPLLGWSIRGVGWLPRVWRAAPLVSWVGLFDTLARSFGHFGAARSSVRVELDGRTRGHEVILSWTLSAGEGVGGWLRAAPAVAVARQVLAGLAPAGARVAQLDLAEVLVELRGRDVQVNRTDMNR